MCGVVEKWQHLLCVVHDDLNPSNLVNVFSFKLGKRVYGHVGAAGLVWFENVIKTNVTFTKTCVNLKMSLDFFLR